MSNVRYGMTALLGLGLGFGLSRIGFADFGEVHRMFTFQDFRLLFTFMGAVGLTAIGLFFFGRRAFQSRRKLHPGTIFGGILFGAGWAVTGACPAIAFVQLGEGRILALVTILGILVGTWSYPKLHARFFRWDAGSCDS